MTDKNRKHTHKLPLALANMTRIQIHEYYQKIISCMPNNVYWLDKNCITQGCNDSVLEFVSLKSVDEFIGIDYDEMGKIAGWVEGHSNLYKEQDQQVISSGVPILNVEDPPIHDKNGEPTYYLTSRMPIFDNSTQEVIGVVGISVNITERKKMEETIRQAKITAELANEAKSEFLRNIEHQLRTPFSGVYSIVRMLADMETDPQKKDLLELTYSSEKELLDFLNDSREQAQTTAILAKKFDLKKLIEKAIIMEKPAAIIKGLTLNFDYPDNLPIVFISDPNRIQRIFLNLLSNAIKFTTKGSVKIAVKLGKQIDEKNYILRLIIADTGIGIGEKHQSLIYEKFYRVSPVNQNKYQGAGLGLYIVKELIADLDGEIDLKSQLNEGSIFICTLPLKRPLIDEMISEDERPKKVHFDKFKQ